MFTISTVLLAIAALGGLTLAALHFRAHGKSLPPTSLAMLHGLLAVVGVILLAIGIAAANGFSAGLKSMPVIALVLFVLAALGGSYMFIGKHLQGRPLPTPVVVIHGLAAIAGFVVLLMFLTGGAATG